MIDSLFENRRYKYDSLFIALSVTIMISYSTLAHKIIDFNGIKITCSGILFSFYFLISTTQTEVYGYREGIKTVWIMVLCQSLFVMIICIASQIQPQNNLTAQNLKSLFGEFWKIMIGTWISVPFSYFINGFIISVLKKLFLGKFFFVRYIIASVVTQASFLLSAHTISLSSKYSFEKFIVIFITAWSYEVMITIILLPIGIKLVNKIKKSELTDVYDWGISYNPFILQNNRNENDSINTYPFK